MLTKKRNPLVSTVLLKNRNGFTFISLLTALSIIAITLPITGALIQASKTFSNYEYISVYQFFLFLRDESIASSHVEIIDNKLIFHQEDDIATISSYQDVVRRQVNGKGHEIYLRNVKFINFEPLPSGIQVQVTNIEGELFEKTIIHYQ